MIKEWKIITAVLRLFNRKVILNTFLGLFSIVFGIFLYVSFFYDTLPMFFSNMENIEKNILALVIVITTIFIFIRMVLNVEITLERYIIFIFYVSFLPLCLVFHVGKRLGAIAFKFPSWN